MKHANSSTPAAVLAGLAALVPLAAGPAACGPPGSGEPTDSGGSGRTAADEPGGEPVRRVVEGLPLVIDEPGTYALARDLDGEPGEGGIVIRCGDVVLDLGEWTLRGQADSGTGVLVEAGCERVSIRGGTLKTWGHDGLDATAAVGVAITGLRAELNGGAGIRAGDGARLERCNARFNWGGRGIEAGADAVLVDCVAESNVLGGIWAGPGAELLRCTARRTTYGAALRAGDGSSLADCASEANLREGMLVGADCELSGCRATRDVAAGIAAGPRAVLTGCEVVGVRDGDGIRVGAESRLVDCSSVDGAGRGVVAGPGTTRSGVEASGNRGDA